jgi:hypothetical protein
MKLKFFTASGADHKNPHAELKILAIHQTKVRISRCTIYEPRPSKKAASPES